MSLAKRFSMVQPNRNTSLRQRLNISRLALSYPRLTISFWIAVAVAGLLAFSSLKYALFPDITFPVVVVDAAVPTETVVATEQQLAIPLEDRLKTLEGLDGLKTSSYSGRAALTLSFKVGTDLNASEEAVSDALAGLDLPDGATYKVLPFNLNESAAVSYALYQSGESVADLMPTVRDRVIPELEKLPGVLRVELRGDAASEDVETTNGDVDPTSGATLVRFNAQDALALEVIKTSEANTLEVVDQAELAVAKLRQELPLTIEQAATQADFIRQATRATLEDLLLAIALAVLIIFPFLWSIRATLIAALAIPISLLGTFIVMAIAGFNLETITLLALALVIGIIIDDAIVDVENITRHIEEGESPKQAAHKATAELGLTVAAATLTIVAVFLPIGLMGGTVGQFFKPFGLTVSAAVLISLLVSRTLSPVLSAMWLERPEKKMPRDGNPKASSGLWKAVLDVYRGLLMWSLDNRWLVVAFAVASLAAGVALAPLIPKGFIPKLDRGTFNVTYVVASDRLANGVEERFSQKLFDSYTVQSGDTLEAIASDQLGSPFAAFQLAQTNRLDPNGELQVGQTLRIPTAATLEAAESGTEPAPTEMEITRFSLQESQTAEERLEASIRENPNVEAVFSVMGERGAVNQGRLFVRLKDEREVHTAVVQDQVRQALPQIEGVEVSVEDIQFVDTGGEKPLQVALQGEDLALLRETGDKIGDRVRAKGFVDVTVTSEGDAAADVTEIQRKDGQRTVYVTANLSQGQALGDATDEVIAEANALLPEGVTIDLGGDSARSNAVLSSFGMTLAMSVGCMLLVLVLLFQRFSDPFVVILSLPLAIVGAMFGLLVTQSDFGMIAVIGIILLMGLVDKSAILIIDYINQLRAKGVSKVEAILQAGPIRLRPILMTALSTILGMMPIALGLGAGSELRQPLAVAAIGGLATSTLLSLIVVPVVYSLFDDAQESISKFSLRLR